MGYTACLDLLSWEIDFSRTFYRKQMIPNRKSNCSEDSFLIQIQHILLLSLSLRLEFKVYSFKGQFIESAVHCKYTFVMFKEVKIAHHKNACITNTAFSQRPRGMLNWWVKAMVDLPQINNRTFVVMVINLPTVNLQGNMLNLVPSVRVSAIFQQKLHDSQVITR